MCFRRSFFNEKNSSWETVPYYYEGILFNIETEEVITRYYGNYDGNESDKPENEDFESEPKIKDDERRKEVNKLTFTDTLLMALSVIGAICVIESCR